MRVDQLLHICIMNLQVCILGNTGNYIQVAWPLRLQKLHFHLWEEIKAVQR